MRNIPTNLVSGERSNIKNKNSRLEAWENTLNFTVLVRLTHTGQFITNPVARPSVFLNSAFFHPQPLIITSRIADGPIASQTRGCAIAQLAFPVSPALVDALMEQPPALVGLRTAILTSAGVPAWAVEPAAVRDRFQEHDCSLEVDSESLVLPVG
jgi:hypothetical protein